jgi:hypothetical protein
MITKPCSPCLCLGFLCHRLPASVAAQSDLDAFMEKVLARRDDNWKKLQQYVLEEKEAFDLTGPGAFRCGACAANTPGSFATASLSEPVDADGVKLSEADRRKAENQWLRRQNNRDEREKRNAERRAKGEPEERRWRQCGNRTDRRSPSVLDDDQGCGPDADHQHRRHGESRCASRSSCRPHTS